MVNLGCGRQRRWSWASPFFHHPPILSALPLCHEQPIRAEGHRSNFQDCAFHPAASSSLWPPPHICRGGKKSFWQLRRRWWQPRAPRRTFAAEALPCVGRAPFLTRIFILSPHPGEVSALVAQNRSDLLPLRARAWWQPGGGGRTLFFWFSLSASGAGPLHRERLVARPPRHMRVRRPPLEPLWWFPLATASFVCCYVVNWFVWLDRLWDQQMETLGFNWDVWLQHKQTPPPSLN